MRFAMGAQGRTLAISSAHKLLVVRLGQQPHDADFADQLLGRVMAAIQ